MTPTSTLEKQYPDHPLIIEIEARDIALIESSDEISSLRARLNAAIDELGRQAEPDRREALQMQANPPAGFSVLRIEEREQ